MFKEQDIVKKKEIIAIMYFVDSNYQEHKNVFIALKVQGAKISIQYHSASHIARVYDRILVCRSN